MSAAANLRPILVVDDEPEMLRSLRNLLRMDFKVFTAGSGAEAMRILEEETIHVVMTDQRMPQMSGVEVLRRAKTMHPQATRLIFTGYADINAVIAAINQGHVFRYVAKPWEPEELVAVLREAGAQYDRILECRQLLLDLRNQEQKCITFAEDLRATPGEILATDRAAQLETLVRSSHDLLARLTSILDSTDAVAFS